MDYLHKILGKSRYARFKSNAARYSGISNNKQVAGNVDELPIETAVIVPSTVNRGGKSYSISPAVMKRRVESTRKQMSQYYGGYTSVRSRGGYYDNEQGALVQERGVIVTSYASRADFKKNKSKWLAWVKAKRAAWKQQAMGIVIENDMFYINARKMRKVSK